jgi:hypothetical protein
MAAAPQMGCSLSLPPRHVPILPSRDCKGAVRSLSVLALTLLAAASPAYSATYILTVAGLGGEPDYEQRFTMLANDVDKILHTGDQTDRVIETLKGPDATRAKIESSLARIATQAKPADAFVLLLIGHGTFDGTEYKVNLPGPDISGTELATLLNRIPAGRQLVVDTTSASGGAVAALKKENRTVVTATRSGMEKNATVFGRYWVEAMRDPAADVDKNETISALEAFQYAEKKTADFYKEQKRLATEHPQVDDQQRAASFAFLKYGSASAVVTDPAKRALIAKKDEIENRIDALKYQKSLIAPDDYRKQLTAMLLELARVQEAIDK